MDEKSLTIIRTFDAPREAVWDAWTRPSAWVEWYGKPWDVPKDSVAMDVKVGGEWKSTTIADGNTIHFTGFYREVNKPERLVFSILNPKNPNDPDFETVIAVFKDLGNGKCELTFTQEGNLPPEE